MADVSRAEFRKVENREHLGKPAIVAIAVRRYATTVEDLWKAVTTPERLARWFLPVEGNLELGGRYQLKGNAGGTITRCDPPEALDLTWEMGGGTSWVQLRLAIDGDGARLTLEHIAHRDGIGKEHLERFGPGAVGVGWDLGLHGLARHIAERGAALDPAAVEAWTKSDEGKAFVRASGEAWGAADAESGEDPENARAKAERTIAFYTGG
ncbi:MAG: SRPBCC family protein [Labilithrix sp.]|nr:SRPBCC family protein [Labilithrix sp.]